MKTLRQLLFAVVSFFLCSLFLHFDAKLNRIEEAVEEMRDSPMMWKSSSSSSASVGGGGGNMLPQSQLRLMEQPEVIPRKKKVKPTPSKQQLAKEQQQPVQREAATAIEIETPPPIKIPARVEGVPRKVFIDLGANCGNSYMKIKANKKTDILTGDGWEVYLFEPNPQMYKFFLNDLAKNNPGVQLIQAAVSNSDSEMDFFLTKGEEDVTDTSQFKDSGACNKDSIKNPSGASTLMKNARGGGKSIKVKVVDFAVWLQKLGLQKGDRFVLKVDIEGAELDLFNRLFEPEFTDICIAELINIEWHAFVFEPKGKKSRTPEFYIHTKYREDFPQMVKDKCGEDGPKLGRWH